MGSKFSQLKAGRNKTFQKLAKKAEALSNPSNSYKDERFWELTYDKAGNGNALIRFLPPSDGSDAAWVQTYSHAFQGPRGWYIENCLSTIGKPDPVNELNSELWEAGEKETVRKQKRKLNYISNVYIVDDPANPENNGKVFLFKYGKQIFDILNDAMFPEDEDEEPINPFDLWEGATFKLIRSKKGDEYPTYTKSKLLKPKPLFKTDDEEELDTLLENVWKQQYRLEEFIDPESEHFKPYEKLKARLDFVLGKAKAVTEEHPAAKAAPLPSVDLDDEEELLSDEDEIEEIDLEEDDVDDIPFDLDGEDEDDIEDFKDLM